MKAKQNGKTKILIAEDSRTQAEQLGFMLEQHGYNVTIAANGKLALEAAQAQNYALLISDILMPEMDGYELCKAVKSDEKLKDIPVILVTTLSDAQDVIRGLECGADNFIRKPYDERYLLSRIDYMLMNLELRQNQKMQVGVEIKLGGHKYFVTSERQQILDLLISTYEQAVHINDELKLREKDLAHSNEVLNGLYRIAEGLNHAVTEREVAEATLERAMEVPGVQGGWICLREGESDFRLVAMHNLPPAFTVPGALDGNCACRKQLLSGKFDSVSNIIECERLAKVKGDTHGLRWHASVPLWLGGRTVGLMNLIGPKEGLFDEEELKVLHGVGNQVAVAMERAKLHEHLEQLVEERTAALRASEARWRTIIDAEPECVKIVDADGWIVQINAAGLAMIDADSFEQVRGVKIDEFVVPEQQEAYRAFEASVLDGKGAAFEFEIAGLKGARRWLETHAVPLSDPQDGRLQMLAIGRNITQRKANEARIARLNRIYAVLSGINTTIVRVHDEDELFREACRIAVEHGQFAFAWIGKFDADNMKVTPAAKAGRDDGYLAQLFDAREGIQGSCALTTQALTEVKPVVCNDIASDERMAVRRSEALRRGYRSVAVFPLVVEMWPVGMFALYALEPDAFDDNEMKLLIEMAGDISYALDHFNREAQRMQAEAALEQSRNLLKTVIDTSPLRIFWKDTQLRYMGCNPAFAGDAGVDEPENIIGKDDFQLPWRKQAEVYRADDRQVMDSGIPKLSYDETYTTPDGRTNWVRTSKAPLHNAANETIGLLGIYEDITGRKQAEDELRKLSLAVEQSPNSIVITDLDAKLEYVNEAFVKVTGYSRAEAIGQNPSILHSGKNSRATYDDMWAHLTRGEVWRGELINRRKDGSEYVESVLISPVRDSNGKTTHYLGIKEDITERKQAESRLAEQLDELRRWHEATLGREMRAIELKREVNELLKQAGQPPRYPSAEEGEQ